MRREGYAVIPDSRLLAFPFACRYTAHMEREALSSVWSAVDDYINDHLIPADPALLAALETNTAAGLPVMDVAPNQGKFLYLLACIARATRILEIGTLGGYSTLWLAKALPADGVLVTLELEPKHAEAALANIARAGFSCAVDLRLGPAGESLAHLHEERTAPFDLIFIDADKQNNPLYLEWSLRLSRPGTVIVVDNVVRAGELIDADSTDPRVTGTRRLFEMIAAEPRLDATAIQTVGSKGYDGFTLAIVNQVT
jgi:predicted O-methyltransferase YrrM